MSNYSNAKKIAKDFKKDVLVEFIARYCAAEAQPLRLHRCALQIDEKAVYDRMCAIRTSLVAQGDELGPTLSVVADHISQEWLSGYARLKRSTEHQLELFEHYMNSPVVTAPTIDEQMDIDEFTSTEGNPDLPIDTASEHDTPQEPEQFHRHYIPRSWIEVRRLSGDQLDELLTPWGHPREDMETDSEYVQRCYEIIEALIGYEDPGDVPSLSSSSYADEHNGEDDLSDEESAA